MRPHLARRLAPRETLSANAYALVVCVRRRVQRAAGAGCLRADARILHPLDHHVRHQPSHRTHSSDHYCSCALAMHMHPAKRGICGFHVTHQPRHTLDGVEGTTTRTTSP